MKGKWITVSALAFAAVAAFALWFSMTAVIPALRREVGLGDFEAALLASSVALGFVAGTLGSAVLGLADRLDPRRFFVASALTAAAANLAAMAAVPDWTVVAAFRFVVGACMAGVYPVGMKIMAGWAERGTGRSDMGLLTGLLVGALTVGTASPHLFNAFGGVDWRLTLVLSSTSAVAAAVVVAFVRLGPHHAPSPPFQPGYVLTAWRDRALRLANFGYFGHMWELYAMWGWIGVFLHASFSASMGETDAAATYAALASFAVVGAGAAGCLAGGIFADRLGRTTITIAAMAVSGACSLLVGFLFAGDPWLLVSLCLIWGVAVVADSAQFSSSVIELSDPSHAGTMVTVQVCVGFLLTMVTLHLMPPVVAIVGWRYAFAVLAVGPLLGVVAMARLRAHPDASRLAAGRR